MKKIITVLAFLFVGSICFGQIKYNDPVIIDTSYVIDSTYLADARLAIEEYNDAYKAWLINHNNAVMKIIDEAEIAMQNFATNPLLYGGDSGSSTKTFYKSYLEVQKLLDKCVSKQPPNKYAKTHKYTVSCIKEFKTSLKYYYTGSKNLDANSIETGGIHLEQACLYLKLTLSEVLSQ